MMACGWRRASVTGTVQPQGTPQTVAFHPGSIATRDFLLHRGRDALDDAESRARRHRPQGDSRRLFVGGKDGDGAESRSGDGRVFEDEIYRRRLPDSLR